MTLENRFDNMVSERNKEMIYKVTLTRQSEEAGQGFLDRAEILVRIHTPSFVALLQPGRDYNYGFERDWIIESSEEYKPKS